MSTTWFSVIITAVFLVQAAVAAPPSKPKEDLNGNALLSLLTPKTIFVTSASYNGDLVSEALLLGEFEGEDGLEAADFICQIHADIAELNGKYKAVLSSSAENASARISTSLGPYKLVDGTPVAENHAALFSTRDGSDSFTPDLPPIQLIHAVRRDEDGIDIEGGGPDYFREAWTGSQSTGAAVLTNTPGPGVGSVSTRLTTCGDWTSSEVEDIFDGCDSFNDPGVCGTTGQAMLTTPDWLDTDRAGCDQTRRLYCAEQ
jgi:hypothetical protein